MIKVIERATGKVYTAKEITGGYEVYDGSTLYKKLRESTFKKYFKLTGETVDAEESKPTTAKATENDDNTVQDAKVKTAKPSAKAEKKAQPTPEPEPVEPVSAEKRQQIIDKIKKLLALSSNNPSKEEAISATLMAQKLMAKYRIQEDETLDEIQEEDLIESIFTTQKHDSSFHAWRKQLAVIVARNFCCKCYMKGADVVFRGYKQDAEIALNAYMYLYTVGDKLGSKAYKDQLATTGSGKGAYNSFVLGFLKGVDEGLSVQCTALMLIVPQAVEDEWQKFSANFSKGKTQRISVTDSELYMKGREEGKNAIQSRQIESSKGRR